MVAHSLVANQPLGKTPVRSDEWSYEAAFQRNLGVIDADEQARLRQARVAIIGMGGVGGSHLMTLTRLGIGGFTIADPDEFELANFNRQYGATVDTLGRPKVSVMAEQALAVNPELQIRAMPVGISKENVGMFLDGADVVVDGVDFFAIEERRMVFNEARKRGQWVITAGPHACGAAWLLFSPRGMSFDEYFDIRDSMTKAEMTIAFAVGTVPCPLHLAYLDLKKYFKPQSGQGGSVGFACTLASAIVAAEVRKILDNHPDLRPAPCYAQFDLHRTKLKKGRLFMGNRHPWQRVKRRWLTTMMQQAASK